MHKNVNEGDRLLKKLVDLGIPKKRIAAQFPDVDARRIYGWFTQGCPEDRIESVRKVYPDIIASENHGLCVYRPEGVICESMKCESCGWNPDVERIRMKEVRHAKI